VRIIRSLLVGFVALLLVASVFGTAIGAGVSVEDESSLSGGSVAEEDAIEIEDWHDLDAVRDDLDGEYILMNDLDETTSGYDELVNTTDGWEPIGDRDNPFNGTFDGNGYNINGLYIYSTTRARVGLVGVLEKEGYISNVNLTDISITEETDFRTPKTGGVVGLNQGTVEKSNVEGEVSGRFFVGGLVGRNEGVIKQSSTTVEVTGNGEVGGLVGSNDGTVENSYATGDVNAERRVGGLVGRNLGTVSNSYSTGDVSGDDYYVGGLVGSNDGTVENSYATGEVSGDDDVGGLVGYNDGVVENSFWDIETSGIEESDGGTGLTTDEMTGENAPNNLDGFDFEEIWETIEEDHEDAEEDGYPILQELSR